MVLVQGKGSPDSNYLLDLKQALPSALAVRAPTPQPHWPNDAHRIADIQRRMRAVSPAFLHVVTMGDADYVLHALQPSEDRVTLDAATRDEQTLEQTIRTLASVVAWAQLRSCGRAGSASADALMAHGQRSKWRQKLLDASSACASQVVQDAHAFDEAYDAGALD